MTYEPTTHTTVLVAIFAAWYLLVLSRRTLTGRLDFYDLIMLSMVALLPAIFVFWPRLAEIVGILAGVTFPFVVMFGVLTLVVFIFLHRITLKLHKLERLNRLLVQEISLLRFERDAASTAT
jgi:hypothetical protein